MKTTSYHLKQLLSLCGWLIALSLIAQKPEKPQGERNPHNKAYTIEQSISERAQLHTAAFNGLAFLTGSFGADCFFPPGKVADFFGFQFMRDNDKSMMGHNTDFLTRIASNVIRILTPEQLKKMATLADKQAPIYDAFAYKRMILIKAFRTQLESDKVLNRQKVIDFCAELYDLDAQLSYDRAVVVGDIIASLSDGQKAELAKMKFDDSSTWPVISENLDKQSMSHRSHVAVMTYASELFSWYAGNVTADVYFCPERHGTYFGGFYLKDYPAMGNHGYNISTALTGDKGRDFEALVAAGNGNCLLNLIQEQKPMMQAVVKVREEVATELRRAMKGETPDRAKVFALIHKYGAMDGELSYGYANCYARTAKTLSATQKAELIRMRNLEVLPKGTYLYSDPIDLPANLDISFLLNN